MSGLKPCPFCGSADIQYHNDVGMGDGGFWEWIECEGCGAKQPTRERWNTRAPTCQRELVVAHALLEQERAKVSQLEDQMRTILGVPRPDEGQKAQ